MKMKTWQAVTVLVLALVAILIIASVKHMPKQEPIIINSTGGQIAPMNETISPSITAPKSNDQTPAEVTPVVKQQSKADVTEGYATLIDYHTTVMKRLFDVNTKSKEPNFTMAKLNAEKQAYIDHVLPTILAMCDDQSATAEHEFCVATVNEAGVRAALNK